MTVTESPCQSPGYESPLPVTEKSNPLSRDIDRAGPQQIVRVLQECDAEVFQGDLQTDAEYKVRRTTQ